MALLRSLTQSPEFEAVRHGNFRAVYDSLRTIWLVIQETRNTVASLDEVIKADLLPVRTLEVNTTQVGTNADVNEKTFHSYTLPGGTLELDGDRVLIESFGTTAATAESKRMRLYFGSTVVSDPGAFTMNNVDWVMRAWVIRTGAATQKAYSDHPASLSNWGLDYTTPTETLSGDIVIKDTGQNGFARANDAVGEGLTVRIYRSPEWADL